MSKRIRAWLLVCLALIMTGCGSSSSPAPDKNSVDDISLNENIIQEIKDRGVLRVGCKADVPELGYYDEENDAWSGKEVDIAYETAAAIFDTDVEEVKNKDLLEIIAVTVDNREKMLLEGKIDIVMATYTITDERKEKFAISEGYYSDYIGVMVRDAVEDANSLGDNSIKDINDLDGKYVGVPRNATTRDAFIKYVNGMDSVSVNPIFCEFESYDMLVKALKDGTIDAMAVDACILNGYVDDALKILDTRFDEQNYGAAVKKENAELIKYVNVK